MSGVRYLLGIVVICICMLTTSQPTASEPVVVCEPEPEPVVMQEARISFYCNCPTCCGKWYTPEAIGKGGIPLQQGKHCAATKDIPMWSTVEIEGLGTYIVADKVADWVYEKHGTTIDIFMGTDHAGAWKNGVQRRNFTYEQTENY